MTSIIVHLGLESSVSKENDSPHCSTNYRIVNVLGSLKKIIAFPGLILISTPCPYLA